MNMLLNDGVLGRNDDEDSPPDAGRRLSHGSHQSGALTPQPHLSAEYQNRELLMRIASQLESLEARYDAQAQDAKVERRRMTNAIQNIEGTLAQVV